jgi:hypothetical protein
MTVSSPGSAASKASIASKNAARAARCASISTDSCVVEGDWATTGRMANAGAAPNRASAARRDLWPSAGIAPPAAEAVLFFMG